MANYVNAGEGVRMRHLFDVAFLDDDFPVDWPRNPENVQSWQWQLDEPHEPKDPQPATEEGLKKLVNVEIKDEGKECSICLMEFKLQEIVKAMPCSHAFHEMCLLTWLSLNNTCPFCRFRLPTDSA